MKEDTKFYLKLLFGDNVIVREIERLTERERLDWQI